MLNAYNDFVDFYVTVPKEKQPVILQLTDPQILDASQKRYPDRIGAYADAYWAKDKMDERCNSYIKEAIEATKPDLILITGDLVYGEFDDDGTSFTAFVDFMERFEIPWAPIFGNHENDSTKGVDWQCKQLESAEHCLFRQRTLTGNGNYTVGILQGEELKRVFFMLDSNGCGGMSGESLANGHSTKTIGFGKDQIEWFTSVGKQLNTLSPDTKISFAFHIPISKFRDAYAKYGFRNDDPFVPIDIDAISDKADTDFGYLGGKILDKDVFDLDDSIYCAMKQIGTDSVFVGHYHDQSASVVYDGVRFQFGQKSSTYDAVNYKTENGEIVFSFTEVGVPMIGGTVMKLSEQTGDIKEAYIYYCHTEV